ncbi:hypothetical protein [Alloactinosynnema sp. L-07]|nr:hypothetical protein [Alloactinosynnema sp. L-07]
MITKNRQDSAALTRSPLGTSGVTSGGGKARFLVIAITVSGQTPRGDQSI